MCSTKTNRSPNQLILIFSFMDKVNLSIVRQSFAAVVWTHKIHMKCVDLLENRNDKLKVWNIVLVSLVLIFTILQVRYPSCEWIYMLSLTLTISEFILLVVTLTFNYWELANRHKNTAESLLTIRDKYLCLIGDIINDKHINIEERRDSIKEVLDIVYKFAPQQVEWAYWMATKSLGIDPNNQTWDYTYSDDEIDRFLTPDLRSSNY